MDRRDFDFELPESLIAQQPPAQRSAGRLLRLFGDTGQCADHGVDDLPDLLNPGDLLVCNDTRVVPARLFGHKPSGGRVELLLERIVGTRRALMQLRASKTPAAGSELKLEGGARARVVEREAGFFQVEFDRPVLEHLEEHGHMPLPPYIRRPDDARDRERYQTVFAAEPGAVAAPTAGLHFDAALLARLTARGVERCTVTLHVGAGTFQPVRVDDIREHVMHAEYARLGARACATIAAARARGARVVAVGTTALRTLESAAQDGELLPFAGPTRLFVYPGFRFRVVDMLFTNFHLPQSTLLMLVAAFAGRDHVLAAYRHAVEAGYRFFSYGDAMLASPQRPTERAA